MLQKFNLSQLTNKVCPVNVVMHSLLGEINLESKNVTHPHHIGCALLPQDPSLGTLGHRGSGLGVSNLTK